MREGVRSTHSLPFIGYGFPATQVLQQKQQQRLNHKYRLVLYFQCVLCRAFVCSLSVAVDRSFYICFMFNNVFCFFSSVYVVLKCATWPIRKGELA